MPISTASSYPEHDAAARILIVDDDAGIRQSVSDYLADHGFSVDVAANASAMDAAMESQMPELVVLDVMLPGEDGLAICRRLAALGGPSVIMLSAMGEDGDRILGLELGADDYLAKPCNPRELLARVKAVLRRRTESKGEGKPVLNVLAFDGWRMDPVRHELRSPGGELVALTSGEFRLLQAFVEHPRRVLSRDYLIELARGGVSEVFDRAMDVQISRLRKKLQNGSTRATGPEGLIRTIRNEGYILDAVVTRLS